MTPKDPLFGGDFLGQILAADSLPGAFVPRETPKKKTRVFLFAETLKNPWKRMQKGTKRQGKSENERARNRKKSKDWRVRAISPPKLQIPIPIRNYFEFIPIPLPITFRDAPDTFNFLRHVMRAIWSVRPKCSHRCVSLKETPLKPVQILKHTTFYSAEQTAMRTKWFKHIAI